jgi:predicted Zn finger-like uncharacterized protein
MKITCQSCQAKYTIADEKVVGKTVKIKCKKCGATVVVNGTEAAARAPYPGPPPMDEEGATRVFSGPEPGAAPPSDEWTVNVSDEDQRSMTTGQIAQGYAAGTITADTYVWRDGMSDWLPLSSVPELVTAVSRPAPAAGGPAQPSPIADEATAAMTAQQHAAFAGAAAPQPQEPAAALGLGGTMVQQPYTAPSVAYGASPAPQAVEAAPAAAARRASSAGRSGVDLFGGTSEQRAGAGGMFPAAAAPARDDHDRLVGERNENSVLFSLSALTASENASKPARGRDDSLIDMRPAPAAPAAGRRDVDDIMNLGGGGFASPILAPPPLLAPVVEPPPQAAPAVPASVPGAQGMGAMSVPPPKKGSMVGLIAGVTISIGLVGGAAIYFLRPAPPPPAASQESATASVHPSATPAATAAAPATAAPAPAPADTASAAPSASAVAAAAPTEAPSAKPAAAAAAAASPGKPDKPSAAAAAAAAAAPAPAAAAPAAPAKTAEPAPAPAAAGNEFNRGAAASALGGAAGAAKGCKKPDGPTGSGRVKVTFAPSGNVTSAVVDGPPFSGTSVGGCIAAAFRGAHVPPFDGAPVVVSKSFTIN